MKIYEGKLVSDGIKVGVVCARFNDFLVSKLLSGCEDGLLRRGVRGEDIEVGLGARPHLRSPSSRKKWPRAGNTTRSSPWGR